MIFSEFHDKHGLGEAGVPYSPSNQVLPLLQKVMADEWSHYGIASYAEGVIWTVDPLQFRSALMAWLPEWYKDRSADVFARTAFGDLLVLRDLGGTESVGCVSVQYGRYSVLGSSVRRFFNNRMTDRRFVAIGLSGILVRDACERLGPLESDEMFTFVPALPLGGSDTLEHVQKVKMMPQLDILSQLYERIV